MEEVTIRAHIGVPFFGEKNMREYKVTLKGGKVWVQFLASLPSSFMKSCFRTHGFEQQDEKTYVADFCEENSFFCRTLGLQGV
jgi:hypothetical protein